MGEAEWQACADPWPMLEASRERLSERKLRLFAVACARRIWNLLQDERGRRAVQAAEDFADGAISAADLAAAKAAITGIPVPPRRPPGYHGAMAAAWYASGVNAWYAAWHSSRQAAKAVGEAAREGVVDWDEANAIAERARDGELAIQAGMLRELVGPHTEKV
jgi:hypothetical protein